MLRRSLSISTETTHLYGTCEQAKKKVPNTLENREGNFREFSLVILLKENMYLRSFTVQLYPQAVFLIGTETMKQ